MANDIRGSLYPPRNVQLNVFQTWALALLPSERNYAQIASDPGATLGRAYVWLLIASLIGGVISTLISAGVEAIMGPSANPLLQTLGQGVVTGQSLLVGVLCGVPIQAVLLLIGVTIGAGLSHGLASALGGHGTFTQLLYAISAYAVPLILISSLISSLPCIGLLAILLVMYALVLNIVATKAVYQFGWGQAVMSSIIVPVGALVLVACLAILALALLGPAIGNVFSSIVTDI